MKCYICDENTAHVDPQDKSRHVCNRCANYNEEEGTPNLYAPVMHNGKKKVIRYD